MARNKTSDWSAVERRQRFEELFRRHHDAVAAYVLRRSRQDADDVLDETFLVAWRRLEEVPEAALPWLLGVARRVLANQRRSARRRQALVERVQELPEPLPDDPLDSLAGEGRVLDALHALSLRDQEALTLVAWEGLEPGEAARALDCSRTAFAMRLKRARRRFAQALERIESREREPRSAAMITNPTAQERP